MNNKISCLLVVLCLITFTQQQKKDPAFMTTYQSYKEECSKEQGIELDVVRNFWASDTHSSDNDKLNCYFKCLSLKLGVMTEAGEVVDDVLQTVAQQFVDDKTDDEIRDECGQIEGKDLCQTAIKLMACIKAAELD